MADVLKKNIAFYVPYVIFLVAGLCLLSLYSKPEIHIAANQYHSVFFDRFFYYLTFLGDGIFSFSLIVIMLFIRFRNFFYMAVGTLLALAVVSLLKNVIFEGALRPYNYFKWIHPYGLHLIEGVDYNGFNSFPSGHTMSAFCSFLGLAFLVKNNVIKFLFFLIALLIGYSRVYLSQHFFVDIVFGSIIAVVFMTFSFYFFTKLSAKWLDKSLIGILKKS